MTTGQGEISIEPSGPVESSVKIHSSQDQPEIHSSLQCESNVNLPVNWAALLQQSNAPVAADGTGTSVRSSSSSGNASYYATASSTSFGRRWIEKMLSVREDTDKRLAKAYPSFVLGRFLGIASSITLVFGLIIKFCFLGSASIGSIIAYIIITISITVFAIAAGLVIWATVYQSANARKQFLQNATAKKSTVQTV